MTNEYCCDRFEQNVSWNNITHEFEQYIPNNCNDKWHLRFFAGDSGGECMWDYDEISFCPYCGAKLE